MKRGESRSASASRPARTSWRHITESASAQPTHEPVFPWSPTVYQGARRSARSGGSTASRWRFAAAAAGRVVVPAGRATARR